MKASEIRELGIDELRKKEGELNQELFNLRYQLHTGQLESTARISQVRKDIARLKTVLTEKQQ
jgi:large subunit ribosomal protein L29